MALSLPPHWRTLPLREVADVVAGQSPPSATYNLAGVGLPFYQGKGEFGEIYPVATKWCTAPARIAEAGDVVISVRAPVGPTNLIVERSAIGRGLAALRPRNGTRSKYLLYVLRATVDELRSRSTGTTFEAISADVLRGHLIPMPPPEDQEGIIAKLEEQLTCLGAARSSLTGADIRLQRYREALIRHYVTGAASSDRYRVWQSVTLKDVAEIVGGVTKDAKREARPGLVEVPYLRVANVQRGYLDLRQIKTIRVTSAEVDALRLQPGDILFNEGGDRDKLGRGWIWSGEIDPCIHQNHVFRARLRDASVHPKFVSWYANSVGRDYLFAHGRQTTNLASISKSQLGNLPIRLPPYEDQMAIVANLERALSVVDELSQQVAEARRRADSLEKAVLIAGVSGRLTTKSGVIA